MSIFYFLVEIYFAAVLGIAGLAKLDDPRFFASVLYQQHIFPRWSIELIKKFLPWIEVILAILLLFPSNASKAIISLFVLAFFTFFLFFNFLLHQREYTGNSCGCFGKHVQMRNFTTEVATSFIQFLLAIILVALSFWTSPLSWSYYFISSAMLIAVFIWLAWRIRRRHQQLASAREAISSASSLEKTVNFIPFRMEEQYE